MATTTQRTKKAADVAKENGYNYVSTKFEAYTGNEPYLFISYSHRDTMEVYPILDALHDRKYRIWYDESCENGNDFREELREKISVLDRNLRDCPGTYYFASTSLTKSLTSLAVSKSLYIAFPFSA